MDRRQFLQGGVGGLIGLLAARYFDPRRARAAAAKARAQACILLWMNGGPSHLDTWDLKPGSPAGGAFKTTRSSVREVEICEHLPELAAQAHRLAILRGMTSREGNHDRARHLLHTGYAPNPTVAFPSLGGWVAAERGEPQGNLPAFVSISGPSLGAGFLGAQNGPFVVLNPNQPPLHTGYARNVNFVRFVRRKGALDALDRDFAAETGDGRVKGRQQVYGKAIRLMYAPRLAAFDIAEEPEAVRRAYGNTDFGRGCLMARRLVEAGVRFVEVALDGWDTHVDNFGRTAKLMAALDPATATLLSELAERELLDSTLVVWMGEFGRTPKINATEGRDHHPAAWSAVLAGGGVRGGIVHGATDADGATVVDQPTTVPDLFATLTTLLGINPDKTMTTPLGRPVAVTDNGTPIAALLR